MVEREKRGRNRVEREGERGRRERERKRVGERKGGEKLEKERRKWRE